MENIEAPVEMYEDETVLDDEQPVESEKKPEPTPRKKKRKWRKDRIIGTIIGIGTVIGGIVYAVTRGKDEPK